MTLREPCWLRSVAWSDTATSAMQFVENRAWIERFNINYHLGVDGISQEAGLTTHHEVEAHTDLALIELPEFARIAQGGGFSAVCMRASQVGVHSSADELKAVAAALGAGTTILIICRSDSARERVAKRLLSLAKKG